MRAICANVTCRRVVVILGIYPISHSFYCGKSCLQEYLLSEPENGNRAYTCSVFLKEREPAGITPVEARVST